MMINPAQILREQTRQPDHPCIDRKVIRVGSADHANNLIIKHALDCPDFSFTLQARPWMLVVIRGVDLAAKKCRLMKWNSFK
jgi:hypothetical protein